MSAPSNTTNSKTGESAGEKVKGALAGIHGLGEKLRGEFNAGVDRAFDEVCFSSLPFANIGAGRERDWREMRGRVNRWESYLLRNRRLI